MGDEMVQRYHANMRGVCGISVAATLHRPSSRDLRVIKGSPGVGRHAVRPLPRGNKVAVRYHASPLSVCLSQEDLQWLTKFASHEDISVHALVSHAVRHFRSWQEKGKESIREVLELIDLADREYET